MKRKSRDVTFMEEWLLASDMVCDAPELKEAPDHTTLARTYAKITESQWQAMLQTLLERLDPKPVNPIGSYPAGR